MPDRLQLRVTLLDSWEEIAVQLPATALVSELKRAVLAHARIRGPAGDYLVKYKGAELEEGGRSGVPRDHALIPEKEGGDRQDVDKRRGRLFPGKRDARVGTRRQSHSQHRSSAERRFADHSSKL